MQGFNKVLDNLTQSSQSSESSSVPSTPTPAFARPRPGPIQFGGHTFAAASSSSEPVQLPRSKPVENNSHQGLVGGAGKSRGAFMSKKRKSAPPAQPAVEPSSDDSATAMPPPPPPQPLVSRHTHSHSKPERRSSSSDKDSTTRGAPVPAELAPSPAPAEDEVIHTQYDHEYTSEDLDELGGDGDGSQTDEQIVHDEEEDDQDEGFEELDSFDPRGGKRTWSANGGGDLEDEAGDGSDEDGGGAEPSPKRSRTESQTPSDPQQYWTQPASQDDDEAANANASKQQQQYSEPLSQADDDPSPSQTGPLPFHHQQQQQHSHSPSHSAPSSSRISHAQSLLSSLPTPNPWDSATHAEWTAGGDALATRFSDLMLRTVRLVERKASRQAELKREMDAHKEALREREKNLDGTQRNVNGWAKQLFGGAGGSGEK
ncbi:hypothetical protein RQP46_007794 [Phenoliferia psychrophenolica]